MKPNMKACGQAMVTAMVNAVLALALMLLVEFAISGTFQMAEPYLWAGLLIWLVIFIAQFWRQRHLCRSGVERYGGKKRIQVKLFTGENGG
ncbi:hypothetical protein MARLIPOL_01910 [Marinobacter lipolyticus SM19]|uniref:Uncharacterized protein n=1 Tax=Marinobacter lipolyticus SM19 TaxID=1318628 RepID=R8B5D0_9GAMM|nr:hypothetical protein [Marinobacter lipolyticus]EON93820.1 hypothetical protein MARLIPOL_01910 [Marinobacter lipolyticus SM19]